VKLHYRENRPSFREDIDKTIVAPSLTQRVVAGS